MLPSGCVAALSLADAEGRLLQTSDSVSHREPVKEKQRLIDLVWMTGVCFEVLPPFFYLLQQSVTFGENCVKTLKKEVVFNVVRT